MTARLSQLRRFRGDIAEMAFTFALLLVLLAWVGGNAYREDLVILGATYSLLAMGMYVPFIMRGSLSLAYNAYLATGAYTVGLVATETSWPLVVAFPIAALVSAVMAVVLGVATRRLSGFYLAAVTLLFGIAFDTWLIDADDITGGPVGIGGIRDFTIFGATLDRSGLVFTALVVVWLCALLVTRLYRSPFGVAARAARQVPVAVEATGVSTIGLTLFSVALGAAIASIGGGLFATVNRSVGPETFTLSIVFLAIFMPLLGGQGSAWGAVAGAVLVVAFTFHLTLFRGTGTLVFALAVLIVLVAAPRGILGYLAEGGRRAIAWWARR